MITRATPTSARAAAASALRIPPPACTADRHGRGDGGDEVAVDGLARPGGVEVDGVDPSGPGRDERLGHRDGIVAVHALGREVPLDELHDLAAPQVDRRVEVHQTETGAAQRSTNACSVAKPVRLDFSGWNWVAHTDPRSTEATTGPP